MSQKVNLTLFNPETGNGITLVGLQVDRVEVSHVGGKKMDDPGVYDLNAKVIDIKAVVVTEAVKPKG